MYQKGVYLFLIPMNAAFQLVAALAILLVRKRGCHRVLMVDLSFGCDAQYAVVFPLHSLKSAVRGVELPGKQCPCRDDVICPAGILHCWVNPYVAATCLFLLHVPRLSAFPVCADWTADGIAVKILCWVNF